MTVAPSTSARITVGLVSATVLLAACADRPPAGDAVSNALSSRPSSTPSVAMDSQSPSSSASPLVPRPSLREIHSAATTIREYLHAWVTEGPTRASRFLVTSQRLTNDQGGPRLSAGSLTSYRLYGWDGPTDFTLFVSMTLEFTDDPMAWDRGRNDRFVTAHRRGGDRGYHLEFATGP